MTQITCPCCWDDFPDDQAYIAHRFRTMRDWLTDCGEHDTALRYALKDPTAYRLDSDRRIILRDDRTILEEAEDDHNEGVTRSLGWKTYTRTDGTVWHNPDLEET